MSDPLYSILVGTAGLTLALAIAALLTLTRPIRRSDPNLERRLILVTSLAIVVQASHFTEELVAGFDVLFPELLRLPPWPVTFFVTFNLFWIVVWIVSIAGIRKGVQIALFPVWFLAVGSVANAVAHPAFAIAVRGYFPGLYTSPIVGLAGLFLLHTLVAFTEPATNGRGETQPTEGGAA